MKKKKKEKLVDLTPSKEPMTAKMKESVARVKSQALEAVARREKLNIRFTAEEIIRIHDAAVRNNVRVMPMLREWVIRALELDENRSSCKYEIAESASKYVVTEDRELDETLRQLAVQLCRLGYVKPANKRAKSK